MIWVVCSIYAIASILLSRSFPVLGALGIFFYPLSMTKMPKPGWHSKKVYAARYLHRSDYCIHYDPDSDIKNLKELCSRAGRVNCADCIAEVFGVEVEDVLGDGKIRKRRLLNVQRHRQRVGR
jgi:hypothetical protein